MSEPMYPDGKVKLAEEDGNAFGILSQVTRLMREAGVPQEGRDELIREATSGEYDHLLATFVRWVEVS